MEVANYIFGIINTVAVIAIALIIKLDWKGIVTGWIESKFQKDNDRYKKELEKDVEDYKAELKKENDEYNSELKKENDKFNSKLKEENDLYNHELTTIRDEYKSELDQIANQNKAITENKLYRTKALFDIEIVVLREVCTLMNTMSSKTFKVQYIEANEYLEGKQDYNELINEIGDANTSIDALMEYERFNYPFIEEQILEKLDDLIAKSREVVIAACYFANEYNERGFSSLEDLDRVSEVSEINDIRNEIDGPTIYKQDIELRRLKLPESVDDGQEIADDCEMLSKQIREYIVSLKII